MTETPETTTNPKTQKSKALPVFVILFVLSLGLSLFLFFKYVKSYSVLQTQHYELGMLYELVDLHADSLTIELDVAHQELNTKYNEILALQDIKESLRTELEIKQQELDAAQARVRRLIAKSKNSGSGASSSDLARAKQKLDSLTAANNQYFEQLRSSEAQVEEVLALQEYTARLNDSLTTENTVLNNKLKAASDLAIAELRVEPVRERKDELEVTNRASKISRLRIRFTVLGSDLTAQEDKDIIVRIVSPSGAVLAKNTSELTDSEKLYTMVIPLTYDGTDKRMVYYYDHDAEYTSGKYTAALYHNNNLLDQQEFELR